MGMRMVKKLDFPSMKFSLYFWEILPMMKLNLHQQIIMKELYGLLDKKDFLELTHNWGAENDDSRKVS